MRHAHSAVVTLTDPQTQLEVRAVATVYTDTPGVDWTLYFTNRGQQDTPVLEQVRAVDTSIARRAGRDARAASPARQYLRGRTTGCRSTSRCRPASAWSSERSTGVRRPIRRSSQWTGAAAAW